MKLKLILYLGILFFFVTPRPVQAYLDPSTGSYLFQIFIASLLSSSFFFKDGIKKIFSRIFKKPKDPSEKY